MKIDDIRLENLRLLIREIGSPRAISDLADVSEGNLKEILKGGKLPSGKTKSVGSRLARKIEQGCGKPEGWMDVAHAAQEQPSHSEDIRLSPDEQTLLVLYRRATPDLKRAIRVIAELARHKTDKPSD